MISDLKFLDRIEVAAPCAASWDGMAGNDRVRHCEDCRKHVYNLSDMTRKEAETLVRQNEDGRLCIRYYRRADGTVLTDNCPVGLRAVRNALVKRWAMAASLIAALLHLPGHSATANTPPPVQHRWEVGDMVAPPRRPTAKTAGKTPKVPVRSAKSEPMVLTGRIARHKAEPTRANRKHE